MPSDGPFGLVRLIITTWDGCHAVFFFLSLITYPHSVLAPPLLSGLVPPTAKEAEHRRPKKEWKQELR